MGYLRYWVRKTRFPMWVRDRTSTLLLTANTTTETTSINIILSYEYIIIHMLHYEYIIIYISPTYLNIP